MNRFAERVARIEEQLATHHAVMDRALAEPSFGSLLSLAMTHAANTQNAAKHEILSRLVAERLRCENDSVEANLLPLACDALGRLTQNQLAVLAYTTAFRLGEPNFTARAEKDETIFREECDSRAAELIAPIRGVHSSNTDLEHLEAVGCGKINAMHAGGLMKPWKCGLHSLKSGYFGKLPSVAEMRPAFAPLISAFSITTVGECLGLHVLQQFGVALKQPDWQSTLPQSGGTQLS